MARRRDGGDTRQEGVAIADPPDALQPGQLAHIQFGQGIEAWRLRRGPIQFGVANPDRGVGEQGEVHGVVVMGVRKHHIRDVRRRHPAFVQMPPQQMAHAERAYVHQHIPAAAAQ
ncbi:hypothetical protein D3C85_1310640 [compost metagenome]